jgi:D-alanine-D-alanine ligase
MTTQAGAKRVAVLKGGWSAERAVSLVSGAEVARALAERGYQVVEIDVRRDLPALLAALTPRPDVVFNALHGRGGEDGSIQGVLDILGLPYTHSGVLASAVAMDKPLTKRVLASVAMPMAAGVVASRAAVLAGEVMAPPYVVKPGNEGSSVGVAIVRPGDNHSGLHDDLWQYGETVLVEAYIPGRDLTVAVMSAPDSPARALTVTEIRPHQGFYDYAAKYTEGKATHLVPAPVARPVLDEAMRLAVLAHETLGCRGVSRSDFRFDDARPGLSGLFFLEINTQPGLTPLSLVPEQAAALGMGFGELVAWMVETAPCPV